MFCTHFGVQEMGLPRLRLFPFSLEVLVKALTQAKPEHVNMKGSHPSQPHSGTRRGPLKAAGLASSMWRPLNHSRQAVEGPRRNRTPPPNLLASPAPALPRLRGGRGP